MLPSDIANSVSEFEASLSKVETLIATLQERPWAKVCGPETPPLDSARLHLMIAYAANSLFWIYLRTQGVKVQNHPVKAELERIKVALRKVKEAEMATNSSVGTSEEPAKQPVTAGGNLNAAAAHRFVTAALGISQSKAAGGDGESDGASPAGGSGASSSGKRKEKKAMESGGSGGKKRKIKK